MLHKDSIASEERNLVDEEQEKKIINYIETDDPIKAALDIVCIIPVDPPIESVGRLNNSFHNVTSCLKKRNENLCEYNE